MAKLRRNENEWGVIIAVFRRRKYAKVIVDRAVQRSDSDPKSLLLIPDNLPQKENHSLLSVLHESMRVLVLLYLVHRLSLFLNWETLVTVAHALVDCHWEYFDSLYMRLPLKRIQKLQLVQNEAACVILGTLTWYAHVTPLLCALASCRFLGAIQGDGCHFWSLSWGFNPLWIF